MAAAKKRTLDESTPVPEKPQVRTRWLDGSKFVDPDELGRSKVFHHTVKAFGKIRTVHTPQ